MLSTERSQSNSGSLVRLQIAWYCREDYMTSQLAHAASALTFQKINHDTAFKYIRYRTTTPGDNNQTMFPRGLPLADIGRAVYTIGAAKRIFNVIESALDARTIEPHVYIRKMSHQIGDVYHWCTNMAFRVYVHDLELANELLLAAARLRYIKCKYVLGDARHVLFWAVTEKIRLDCLESPRLYPKYAAICSYDISLPESDRGGKIVRGK